MEMDTKKRVYHAGIAILFVICAFDLIHTWVKMSALGGDRTIVYAVGFCYIFIILGWCTFAGTDIKLRERREVCNFTVAAYITSYKVVEHHDDDGTTYTYYAIYTYEYNDKQYTSKSKDDYGRTPPVGTMVKLLIDPKKPTDLYEVELEAQRIKKAKIFGLIFMAAGFIFTLIFRA